LGWIRSHLRYLFLSDARETTPAFPLRKIVGGGCSFNPNAYEGERQYENKTEHPLPAIFHIEFDITIDKSPALEHLLETYAYKIKQLYEGYT
jgi:hypothetical protein